MSQLKPSPRINKFRNLHRLSQLLDNAIPIPGTPYRIGIDPILGLLPGGGDTLTGALSAYIIVEAAQMGLPHQVIGQMVANLLLDSVIGIVPVLGDLFDLGWKANVKNIALLKQHLPQTQDRLQSNRLFVIGLSLLLVVIVMGFATLTVILIRWLWNLILS